MIKGNTCLIKRQVPHCLNANMQRVLTLLELGAQTCYHKREPFSANV